MAARRVQGRWPRILAVRGEEVEPAGGEELWHFDVPDSTDSTDSTLGIQAESQKETSRPAQSRGHLGRGELATEGSGSEIMASIHLHTHQTIVAVQTASTGWWVCRLDGEGFKRLLQHVSLLVGAAPKCRPCSSRWRKERNGQLGELIEVGWKGYRRTRGGPGLPGGVEASRGGPTCLVCSC